MMAPLRLAVQLQTLCSYWTYVEGYSLVPLSEQTRLPEAPAAIAELLAEREGDSQIASA